VFIVITALNILIHGEFRNSQRVVDLHIIPTGFGKV